MTSCLSFSVYFWTTIVSPHLLSLADAIASKGYRVYVVADTLLTSDRFAQGWQLPQSPLVNILSSLTLLEKLSLIESSPPNAIHICSGLWRNGSISFVQRYFHSKSISHWLITESIDTTHVSKYFKIPLYRRLVSRLRPTLAGVLAIGHQCRNLFIELGVPDHLIYDFAYFLDDKLFNYSAPYPVPLNDNPVRLLFIGQLIPRKRIDLLFKCLSGIDASSFSLTVIGRGPLKTYFDAASSFLFANKVTWIESVPMSHIPFFLKSADCLVLPSHFDGWGAVISESLMCGTPVICSDNCGVAHVVTRLGGGIVFPGQNPGLLGDALLNVISGGPIDCSRRYDLSVAARILGACKGADYFIDILTSRCLGKAPPAPPWELIV